jgi:methylenetetrahydrofolate dehydrogenase (NADP+)/methenyltetrahydrofolate cyclohydrolase
MAADTILLKGKPVAEGIYAKLVPRIKVLRSANVVPGLAVVLVGDDPASSVYVQSKTKTFARMELTSETFHLPGEATEVQLLTLIDQLNEDDRFHGVLVQLPLPAHIHAQKAIERVAPDKDVDGFHPDSLGRLLTGHPRFIPCTPQGILEILEYYNIPAAGRHVVIVGRSTIVGKPMMALLAHKWERGNATVTICHTGTPDISSYTRQAELLIVASGQPQLITRSMVSEGADIVDVGMNRIPDDTPKGYHWVGDVAAEELMGYVHAITPVPGGVGVLTVAMLVSNTVQAAAIRAGAISSN